MPTEGSVHSPFEFPKKGGDQSEAVRLDLRTRLLTEHGGSNGPGARGAHLGGDLGGDHVRSFSLLLPCFELGAAGVIVCPEQSVRVLS